MLIYIYGNGFKDHDSPTEFHSFPADDYQGVSDFIFNNRSLIESKTKNVVIVDMGERQALKFLILDAMYDLGIPPKFLSEVMVSPMMAILSHASGCVSSRRFEKLVFEGGEWIKSASKEDK